MKSKSRTILEGILRILSRWTVKKYDPDIVGVTGSVGKTSTKDAIHTVLRGFKKVRASSGNFNNEIGLPLAILGDWERTGGILFWLGVVATSVFRLIVRVPYPEVLILEYAADRPGDIKYLVSIAPPRIAIITAIGEVPVHVEFYSGPEAVMREKAKLIEGLPSTGFAILNNDDPYLSLLEEKTRGKILRFGFKEGADIRISNFEHRVSSRPHGISFRLEYGGSFIPVRMDRCVGRAPTYAAAAAAAVGIAFGVHLVRISETLSFYETPPHRMKVMSGMHNTTIIDDTYNASPLSMEEAIETTALLPGERKIAILGDMLEIGKYSIPAHEALGKQVQKVFDILVTVGPRAKFIAESAKKAGLKKKNIFTFDTAEEALEQVPELLKEGDLILIKGSRAVGLERILDELRV